MRRLLDLPVRVRLVGVVLLVVVITLSGILAWAAREQRRLAIEQAGSFAAAVVDVVQTGLAVAMMTGDIDQQNAYLADLRKSSHVESLLVLRGPAVSRQFGEARGDAIDDVDRQVLAQGEPHLGTETADGKLR